MAGEPRCLRAKPALLRLRSAGRKGSPVSSGKPVARAKRLFPRRGRSSRSKARRASGSRQRTGHMASAAGGVDARIATPTSPSERNRACASARRNSYARRSDSTRRRSASRICTGFPATPPTTRAESNLSRASGRGDAPTHTAEAISAARTRETLGFDPWLFPMNLRCRKTGNPRCC